MVKWVRSGVLAGAPGLIAELGGDFARLAAAANLTANALDDPDLPIDAAAVPRLLDVAARMLECEDFALRLGERQELGLFGPLGALFSAAPTVGAMLADLAEFFPLHTQGAVVGFAREAGTPVLTYELSIDVHPSHRHVVELGFSVLVHELRRQIPGWRPEEAHFRHAPPRDRRAYVALFGPRVAFDADRNALVFDEAALAAPTCGGDDPGHSMLAAGYTRTVRESRELTALRTERLVRRTLPFAPLSLDSAARLLRLSRRTLQRRLADAGTSYEATVAAVRADLALAYLRDSRLRVAAIAEILQFAETSALSRAVRRWHGASPRAIRRAFGAQGQIITERSASRDPP